MKAYKCFYNEVSKLVDYVEFELPNYSDFTHDPKTNLQECVDVHNADEESMQSYVNYLNEDLASGKLVLKKCKDCGLYFLLDVNELIWYEDRGLSVPKRCLTCRRKRK